MFKYVCPPIDWWVGCMTLGEYLMKYLSTEGNEGAEHVNKIITGLLKEMSEIKEWDGDIREGIYVFMLPEPDSATMELGFLWKQDNNGTTFILSPKELPWVADDFLVVKECENV